MSNVILTRFRRGRTDLIHIRFTLGLTDDPSCLCHFKLESSEHYMLDCFLYTVERQNLYNLVEHLIPKFQRKKNCQTQPQLQPSWAELVLFSTLHSIAC